MRVVYLAFTLMSRNVNFLYPQRRPRSDRPEIRRPLDMPAT